MARKNVSAGRAERNAKCKSKGLLLDKELVRKGASLIEEAELLKKALQQGEGDQALELMRKIEAISREEAREECEIRCVGVLHAAVTQTWSCHMVECELPYHALRKYEVFK
jgi:hypothetical protein